MRVLVVGGAGYIGSHMLLSLVDAGMRPICLDNLSTGYRDAVSCQAFIHGDLANRALLHEVLSQGFDAVMHFASSIQVGESVIAPGKYYENNYSNTLNLLNAMVEHGARRFIFSSTAAVYGEPEYVPIDEDHPTRPINPYGRSKLMVEQTLSDFETAYGMKHVCLRYFNAAGADPQCRVGERHEPETHLIPLILQAASGRRSAVKVFGRDYDTPDGTCIRDYVHVTDLCTAHLLALEHLMDGGPSLKLNLGNGNGFSVQEVLLAAERVTGREIPVEDAPRRQGDPARLVADASRAKRVLGWSPVHSALDAIIGHSWAWELHRSATCRSS